MLHFQSGLFISVLVAFFQLSPAITMPSGGYMCAHYEWPYIYYSHGIVSLLLFSLLIVVYRNSPNKHPLVSDVELKKITFGKDNVRLLSLFLYSNRFSYFAQNSFVCQYASTFSAEPIESNLENFFWDIVDLKKSAGFEIC